MKMNIDKFHRIIILIALAVYFITAYNSLGYLQEDEHYQVIEFAQFKSGVNHIQDISWEYSAKIRSGFLPLIAYAVFKFCNQLSITDPYSLAFILRMLTAILAIVAIKKFVRSTLSFIEPANQKIYICIAYLLWFLPFLNVRFYSETWSGLFFLWAVAVTLKNKYQYFLIGILLGLSFLCRFQTAILSASLLLWLLIIRKEKIQHLFKIIIAIITIILLGIAIDYWFYEKITFTPWNYFYNTIFDETAQNLGDSPWYAYFKVIIARPSVIIGIPTVLSILLLIIKDRKNLLLWLILSFLVIHSIIPHKEPRFLFPLANFIPLLLVSGYQIFKKYFFPVNYRSYSFVAKIILCTFFIINSIALAAVAVRAADGRVAIYKYVYDRYKTKPVKIVYSKWADYFTPQVPANFYNQQNVQLLQLDSLSELNIGYTDTSKINFFVLRRGVDVTQNNNNENLLAKLGYKKEMQSLPDWIGKLGVPTKLVFENEILELYRKQ